MTEIVFILYPDFTQLDFASPYEVFCRLPGARVRIASPDGGDLRTEHGLTFRGVERLSDIDRCDLLCIPGGLDQSRITQPDALDDIRRLAAGATYVTSVCNGSLVLGAAGLLHGKRSACHWAMRDRLAEHGAIPDPARIVRDGNVITGGGVTAGIDFALVCAAAIAGDVAAQLIQLTIEYAPEPPFHAGRPETAPPEVMAAFARLAGGSAA
ncbi:DJ-1/PfpI family protein [Sphingomonas chungangi]|nr:DJ-1/PfpI family protein [Sphingomonas chungangi]